MHTVEAMLETHPKNLGQVDRGRLAACIQACYECSQTCTACADACLSEDMVAELTTCVRTNLDCADVCATTGAVLSRHTGSDANLTRAVLEACMAACTACGDECERHASMHEHCRVCAESCRRCEQACRDLLDAMGSEDPMTKGLPVENRFRLVLVWLLAASSLVLFSVVAPSARANAPAQDPKVADFEVDFMTDMIDHHAMAVMMAESCVQKAVHEDLASMCESIGATQSQEILQMQSWLAEWYGDSHEPQMTTGQRRSMAHLDRLEGEEYEIAFMRSMIRHHWSAVREAARCLDNAEHPELLSLCESIEAAQLEEIARMQGWLEQWYDVRGGRPADTA